MLFKWVFKYYESIKFYAMGGYYTIRDYFDDKPENLNDELVPFGKRHSQNRAERRNAQLDVKLKDLAVRKFEEIKENPKCSKYLSNIDYNSFMNKIELGLKLYSKDNLTKLILDNVGSTAENIKLIKFFISYSILMSLQRKRKNQQQERQEPDITQMMDNIVAEPEESIKETKPQPIDPQIRAIERETAKMALNEMKEKAKETKEEIKQIEQENKEIQHLMVGMMSKGVFQVVETFGTILTPLQLEGLADRCVNDPMLLQLISKLLDKYKTPTNIPVEYMLPLYLLIIIGQTHVHNVNKMKHDGGNNSINFEEQKKELLDAFS